MEENNNKIEDFAWDQLEFFNGEVNEEKISPEDKVETNTPPKEEKTVEEQDNEVIDFEQEDEEEILEETDTDSLSTLNYLKEQGLVEYEIEEGKELSEEEAQEVLIDAFDDSVEARIQEIFNEQPKIVTDFNKFVRLGGDPLLFMKSQVQGNSEFDIEDEDTQRAIVSAKYQKDGLDIEEIEDILETLEESGKLKRMASVYQAKELELKSQRENELLEQQQAEYLAAKKRKAQILSESKKYINNLDSLDGFDLNRRDRKVLPEYIHKPSIKLENGAYVTPLYKDLMSVLNTQEGAAQIAMLVKNAKDGKLDFSSIKNKAVSKATKSFKDNVRRASSRLATKSKRRTGKKDYADYFG